MWLEIHSVVVRERSSVATLASHLSSSGTASSGWLPSSAALAISSAVSFPRTPWCAGTQWMATSLLLDTSWVPTPPQQCERCSSSHREYTSSPWDPCLA